MKLATPSGPRSQAATLNSAGQLQSGSEMTSTFEGP